MRGIGNSQNRGAGACCKRDITNAGSQSNRGNVVVDAAGQHVQLAVSAHHCVGNTDKVVPREDLRRHANEVLRQRSKLFPAPNLFGQAVAETDVVRINPAALSTVFGVLFINAGGKR